MVRVILLKAYLRVKYWSFYHLLDLWFFTLLSYVRLGYTWFLLFFNDFFRLLKTSLLTVILFYYWLCFRAHLCFDRIPISIISIESISFPDKIRLTPIPFQPNLFLLMFTPHLLLFFRPISSIPRGLPLLLMSILTNTNRAWTHLSSLCLHPYLPCWFLLDQSLTWDTLYTLFDLHIFLWVLAVDMGRFVLMVIAVWHISAVYVLVISDRLWCKFWFWLGMY